MSSFIVNWVYVCMYGVDNVINMEYVLRVSC